MVRTALAWSGRVKPGANGEQDQQHFVCGTTCPESVTPLSFLVLVYWSGGSAQGGQRILQGGDLATVLGTQGVEGGISPLPFGGQLIAVLLAQLRELAAQPVEFASVLGAQPVHFGGEFRAVFAA